MIYFQQTKNIVSCFKTISVSLFIAENPLIYRQPQFINAQYING